MSRIKYNASNGKFYTTLSEGFTIDSQGKVYKQITDNNIMDPNGHIIMKHGNGIYSDLNTGAVSRVVKTGEDIFFTERIYH